MAELLGIILHMGKHQCGPLHMMVWRECCHDKKYSLENGTFDELGEVTNDAFFIEGILSTRNAPCKVSKHNKHIPCRPEINFVDESDHCMRFKNFISVLL